MSAATERRRAGTLSALLAGLQAGMLGVCAMLAWLGVSAAWQRRSFWTAENLMASVFFGARSVRTGFSAQTLSGLAVYLLLYSVLGALFVVVVRNRLPARRALLLSVLFSVCWYYVAFRWIFRSLVPLVALLHTERPTIIGHLIYGTFLGRYPVYLRGRPKLQEQPAPAESAPVESAPVESAPGEPAPIESAPSESAPVEPAPVPPPETPQP